MNSSLWSGGWLPPGTQSSWGFLVSEGMKLVGCTDLLGWVLDLVHKNQVTPAVAAHPTTIPNPNNEASECMITRREWCEMQELLGGSVGVKCFVCCHLGSPKLRS